MKIYEKIHYPCGLQREISYTMGILDFTFSKIQNEKIDLCVLHGKKCNGTLKR